MEAGPAEQLPASAAAPAAGRAGGEGQPGPSPLAQSGSASFGAPALAALAPSGLSPPLGTPSPAAPRGGRGRTGPARQRRPYLWPSALQRSAAARPSAGCYFLSLVYPPLPASLRLLPLVQPRLPAGSGRANLGSSRGRGASAPCPAPRKAALRRDRARPTGFGPDRSPDRSPDVPSSTFVAFLISRAFFISQGFFPPKLSTSAGWERDGIGLSCPKLGSWCAGGRGRQYRRAVSQYQRLFRAPQPDARFRVYFLPPTWKMPARLLLTAPRRAVEPLPPNRGRAGVPRAGRARAPFS